MGLEEMLHQDGFQLRDFLKGFDTFFENVADGLHDVRRLCAERRNQLAVLQDKIQNIEWLWVLVLLEHGSEPFLCRDDLWDVISSRHQVLGLLLWILSLGLDESVVDDRCRLDCRRLGDIRQHELHELAY